MKAFVTICSLLASSASAESQYIQNVVPFNRPIGISPVLSPYPVYSTDIYSAPMSPISYTNMVDLQVEGAFPLNTMLIKREAEPDAPYVYKAKVDNPEDGSKYEIDVQVDRFGNGQSHQQIERQPIFNTMRDDYLMHQRVEQSMNNLRQRNQMRTDNRQMVRMMSDQHMMGQTPRMTYSNHMDSNRMNQKMRNQLMRGQGQTDSRMYSMMDQRQMDNMNQRMQEINMRQRNRNMVDRKMMANMAERNQMPSHMIIKREADPAFQYTVTAGHPADNTVYSVGQNMRNQVYGNEMGLMNQRMALKSNMRRMENNLVNQMVRDNMMNRNEMHPRTMFKRDADSFMSYSLPMTNYLMPYVEYQVPSPIGYPYMGPVHIMA